MKITEITVSALRRTQPEEFAPLEFSASATFTPDEDTPVKAQTSEAYMFLKKAIDRQFHSFETKNTDLSGLSDGRYIAMRNGKKVIAEIKTNTKGRRVNYSEYIAGDIQAKNSIDVTTKHL